MAKVNYNQKPSSARVRRVSPLKPGLRGARNWATSQVRAASYSRRSLWRLVASSTFLIVLVIFSGLWLGGFLPVISKTTQDYTQRRLMDMGFVVKSVDVMGEGRMREEDVRKALGVRPGDYLFDVDVSAAQKRVEALSWVDKAVVRRLWPNRIAVYLVERKPYALWQNEGKLRVVDAKGAAISKVGEEVLIEDFPGLKLIVGRDAPNHLADFEQIITQFPDIQSRMSAMVYFETNRWDLIMYGGDLKIKLPHDNVMSALSTVQNLQVQTQLLDRQLSVIDLRLPDRITLAPTHKQPA